MGYLGFKSRLRFLIKALFLPVIFFTFLKIEIFDRASFQEIYQHVCAKYARRPKRISFQN
jgi:hypothetical protein